MKKFTLFILIAILFSSCKTNLITISVQSPAPVTISNSVKQIGIVNRGIPEDKRLNQIHQTIALEGTQMLEEGTSEAIRGLKDALIENGRFESVSVLDSEKLTTSGGGIFPAPLSWEEAETICKKYNLDVLFSLEVFDTELKISPSVIPADVSNPMAVVNAVTQINLTTNVKTGWRIYNPKAKSILDEHPFTRTMNHQANGNPLGAVETIAGRKEYVKKTAYHAGRTYADRIVQHMVPAERFYFIRGGNYDFKIAKRKVRAGDWNGAADLWMKNVSSLRRKTAGRASYNMAIINEINGNVDEAINWAKRSYEQYGIRLALKYIYILNARKERDQLLKIQKTL